MIKGASKVKSVLRAKISAIESSMNDVVKKVGEDMEFVAILAAPPKIDGTIKGEYQKDQGESKYTINVYGPPNAPEMAAYIEFGTGAFAKQYIARLPKDWQETAFKFYINGEGKTPTQPYLYPAFTQLGPRLIVEAEKIVK